MSSLMDSESLGETIDTPHVRQRVKQACNNCRNKKLKVNLPIQPYEFVNKISVVEGDPVVNVKNKIRHVISRNQMVHHLIPRFHYGTKVVLANPIDFSDYMAVKEEKKELEWALKELHKLMRNHVEDLPDIAHLIPWLESMPERSLSEDNESISHDIKKS